MNIVMHEYVEVYGKGMWYDHTNLLRDKLNFYLNNAQSWLSVFVKL